ncbi:MAG: AAA family ATPase [Desulfovibrionaceae bacterium]
MSSEVYQALGLQSNPFPAGACSDHYYHTEATRRILEELHYGLLSRKGFLVLIGEVGLGKTSLLLQLLDRLGTENLATAWVFNTALKKDEILHAIARDFGLDVPPSANLSQTIEVLHQFFLENHRQGKNSAIIIDEAHNLDFQSLEMLRMLSNLELAGDKLVQILLVGQQELKARLWQQELRQFRSRINIFVEMPHLTRAETAGYVNYKFHTVGSLLQLEGRALDLVHLASQGNLRMINLIMEKTIYAMFSMGLNQVGQQAVSASIEDIAPCQPEIADRLRRNRRSSLMTKSIVALVFTAALATALILLVAPHLDATYLARQAHAVLSLLQGGASAKTETAQPALSAPVTPPASPSPAPKDVAPETNTAASQATMAASQASAPTTPPAKRPTADTTPTPPAGGDALDAAAVALLAPSGTAQPAQALADAIAALDPAQLAARLPKGWQLVELDALPPALPGLYTSFAWKGHVGSGPQWIAVWKPPFSLPRYEPDYRGEEVKTLQRLLKRLGLYDRSIDGTVGSGTWRALNGFQKDHGLPQSGLPDPATMLWLNALDQSR